VRARLLPLAATLAVGWLALFPITSVDAYYHLATGRRILDEHTIPTRGVGSASFGQAPWHDNEWGFQVLAALIGRAERDDSGVLVLTPTGRVGLVLLRGIVCAATMAVLAATMLRSGAGPGLSALGVWLAAFLTFGNLFWDVRPQILSYLALAALIDLLERDRRGARGALAGALAVIAVWSSVHGAVVLGCVAFACEAAGAWVEDRARARRLTVAALLAPVAACLNPLGWRQISYAFLYARAPSIVSGNNEWTRPDLLHLPLLVLTVAILGAAVAAGARPRAGACLRVAAFGALFLTAIRHLPFFVIVLVPVVVEAVTSVPAWTRLRQRAALLVAAGIAVVLLSGAKYVGLVPSFGERPSRPLPEAEVRFLAGIPGNGFNAYRFGGFLMWRLYPREVVMMDGRNDLYGAFRTDVYDAILETRPGWESKWEDLVERYRLRWALVDASDPLAAELSKRRHWRRVDQGSSTAALFVADDPEYR